MHNSIMLTAWARTTTSRISATAATQRFFATDASHRPVIKLNGLPARYANATYFAASKAGKLDLVESELKGLAAAASSSKAFSGFLENPLISRDDKTKVVSSLNDKLSETTRNLLITLAGNARLSELPKIVSTFGQLMKAKRGEVDAKIISADTLSSAQLKAIQDAMKSQVPAGKSVIIEAITDPSIVGGLQVQIGDQFLDLSVKNRVDEIARTPLT